MIVWTCENGWFRIVYIYDVLRVFPCPPLSVRPWVVVVVLVIWWHHRRAWPGPGKTFVHAMPLVQCRHLL